MNNFIKLTSVAIMLAGSAYPVLADDVSSSVSTDVSSSAVQPISSVSSALNHDASSAETSLPAVNYGQIISAIQAGKNADLATITETSTINLVLVSDIKANGDATALGKAIDMNAAASATLKASIDTNAALKAKVTDAGYTTDQVVAVLAETDGSFSVVINDQHP